MADPTSGSNSWAPWMGPGLKMDPSVPIGTRFSDFPLLDRQRITWGGRKGCDSARVVWIDPRDSIVIEPKIARPSTRGQQL